MSPIVGQLQIETTKTQFATITLEGDTGTITLGGQKPITTGIGTFEGHNGQIRILDLLGHEGVDISTTAGGNILGRSSVRAGGLHTDGQIAAIASDGKSSISMGASAGLSTGPGAAKLQAGGNGANSEVALFESQQNTIVDSAAITLFSSDASIRAGGAGVGGRLVLVGPSGTGSIDLKIDQENGNMLVGGGGKGQTTGVNGVVQVLRRDNIASVTLETATNAAALKSRIHAGGQGADSELALFGPKSQTTDSASASIALTTVDSTIRAGTLHAGTIQAGNGPGLQDAKAGFISVVDAKGVVKITLDGSTGDIVMNNADCAEEFEVADAQEVDAGTVMVLDGQGTLHESSHPYDRRVAGVISGAGGYKPGIVMDKHQSSKSRVPVALLGKVYCKVDAGFSPIEVGDLLTTSATPGHAMRASDPLKAFGAVIGKALRPLKAGQALIPILIALQ